MPGPLTAVQLISQILDTLPQPQREVILRDYDVRGGWAYALQLAKKEHRLSVIWSRLQLYLPRELKH